MPSTLSSHDPMGGEGGDLDKLLSALSSLTSMGSVRDISKAFGLDTLPRAQCYGIFFGCVVFGLTVTSVLVLLTNGGSFRRIAEQSQTGGGATPIDAVKERSDRPLLLERLLLARDELLRENYPCKDDERGESSSSSSSSSEKEEFTELTKMLLNNAPDFEKLRKTREMLELEKNKEKAEEGTSGGKDVDDALKDGNEDTKGTDRDAARIDDNDNDKDVGRLIPLDYEKSYTDAYRQCRDFPGGPHLPTMPKARCEAYARAYAGCGPYAPASYRASYARMYENVACQTESAAAKFAELYETRPRDLVGRTVRLEPLEGERHAKAVFAATCGEVSGRDPAYDPSRVWGFLDCGPFETEEELRKSAVFRKKSGEAAFAIVENGTDRIIGTVGLSDDDPANLAVQLEPPIVMSSADGTVEQIEACFLLMDRLFALGYRRIQLSVDTKDISGKKLSGRLGFTHEATFPKHMIVKDANRDSAIYGMLNSDWSDGARALMYKKLHGAQAQEADGANNTKEGDMKQRLQLLQQQKESKEGETVEEKKNA